MSEGLPEGTDSSVEQISITLQGLTIAATTSRSGGSARTQISIDGSSQSSDPLHGPSRAETPVPPRGPLRIEVGEAWFCVADAFPQRGCEGP